MALAGGGSQGEHVAARRGGGHSQRAGARLGDHDQSAGAGERRDHPQPGLHAQPLGAGHRIAAGRAAIRGRDGGPDADRHPGTGVWRGARLGGGWCGWLGGWAEGSVMGWWRPGGPPQETLTLIEIGFSGPFFTPAVQDFPAAEENHNRPGYSRAGAQRPAPLSQTGNLAGTSWEPSGVPAGNLPGTCGVPGRGSLLAGGHGDFPGGRTAPRTRGLAPGAVGRAGYPESTRQVPRRSPGGISQVPGGFLAAGCMEDAMPATPSARELPHA